ncbi:MAG: hypothetical protein Q9183_003383 [Haloplaca sp. 2 TL-2023]
MATLAVPPNVTDPQLSMAASGLKKKVETKARAYHSKTPGLSKLPFPAIAIIAAIGLRYHGELGPTAIISYSLGLRHAIDADHIAIIDLVTRRLVATGQKPVAVGTFFSLGHST